jgi:chromosomal replication initiation ATPase DnaA
MTEKIRLKEKDLIRKIAIGVKTELNLEQTREELTDCIYGVFKECLAENSAFLYFQPKGYEEFTIEPEIFIDMIKINLKDQKELEKFERLIEFFFKLKWTAIISKTRLRDIVVPRQFVEAWLVANTTWSLKAVGAYLNNRDHSTVLHSCTAVKDSISVSKAQLNFWTNFNDFLNVYIRTTVPQRLGESA